MRTWLIFLTLTACDDGSTFSTADVDDAWMAQNYERACIGLETAEEDVRSHAAARLSTVSDPVATQCICDAMDNGAGGWDEVVVHALDGSESAELATCLVALVEDPNLSNRSGAVTALMKLRSAPAYEGLVNLLSDDSLDGMTQAEIVQSLPLNPDFTSLLVGLVRDGNDVVIQAAAAEKLSSDTFEGDEIEEVLLEVAQEGTAILRVAAIRSLRARESDSAIPLIRSAIRDENIDVKIGIFNLLSGTDNEREAELLGRALTRRIDSVPARDALLAALVETGDAGRGLTSTASDLCGAIPEWFNFYMNSETHLTNLPDGVHIIRSQNEAAGNGNSTIACLNNLIKSGMRQMSCFGAYYVKYWYVDHLLGETMHSLEDGYSFRLLNDNGAGEFELDACPEAEDTENVEEN